MIEMNTKKLKLVSANIEEIKDIIGEVVGETVDNKLQAQEDKKKKEEHINKVLKKDEMLGKKKELKVEEKPKIHIHSCPSCKSEFEKIGDGFEICKDCGTTDLTIKKGEKMLNLTTADLKKTAISTLVVPVCEDMGIHDRSIINSSTPDGYHQFGFTVEGNGLLDMRNSQLRDCGYDYNETRN